VINRVPKLGSRAAYAQQMIREKLLDHQSYITEHGDDLPEIRNWRWGGLPTGKIATADDNV
jgi:xylulose-5-phosphate/fructose-6-phosphate phosphoketolase